MQSPPDQARAARAAAAQHTDWVLSFPNVTGCGVGRRTVGGRETDEWSLVVFVTRKLPPSALQSHEVIPRQLNSHEGAVLTDVIEVPQPEFLVDSAKYRPLVGGCQIVTAGGGGGTLGAILYDAIDYRPVLLTCNHVVTLPWQRNAIPADARVFQPNPSPGLGRTRLAPPVPVGRTKRIVPWTLAPLGADYAWDAGVDAGIIKPDADIDVAFNVIDLGRHPYVILPPYEGLEVVKRGFVTERTEGVVKYVDVKVIIKEDNGQLAKIGGVNSGFAIQRLGGVFSARGDSGSLVVDRELGAARGIVFGGDSRTSGWSYACEMGAILESLQLETPCTGGLHSMIQRAVRRRLAGVSTQVEGSANGLLGDMVGKMDRFREKYLPETPDGSVAGALGSTLQSLAVDLAEAVNDDEDFDGLLDEAFGDWLVLPTIYDMLEYRLPVDFGQRVIRAFDRLGERRAEVKSPTSWIRPAFSGCGGMKMREFLDSRVSPATEKKAGRKRSK